MVGYNKDLFILPFDHRSSFIKKMFGIEDRQPTEEETEKIKKAKKIIYEAFKKSLSEGLPKESAAILLDEQFGDELLRDAQESGIITILTTEKSGINEFDFEYGAEFEEHVKKYNPTFIKALVHYNPDGDKALNARQREKLAELTIFAYKNGFRLLIEPLVPATVEQLAKAGGDPDNYDRDQRPELTVRMIREMQEGGVNPDVWKLEGMESETDYNMVVQQARFSGRDSVGVVVLGRAAEESRVEHWLKTGAKVNGVIGFAVGRTIFWDPLTSFEKGTISEEDAASKISDKFMHFYKLFIGARQGL